MNYSYQIPDYWRIVEINDKDFIPVNASASSLNKNEDIGYIFGGENDNGIENNSLYEFDCNSEKFTKKGNIPIHGRINHKLFYTKGNKLCIVGGIYFDKSGRIIYSNEILLVSLDNLKCIEKVDIPNGLMDRNQFGASLDYQNSILYIMGGMGKSDLFKIDLYHREIIKIMPEGDSLDARSGMVFEILPSSKLFIFSGFSRIDGIPICHNNYYLYTPSNNSLKYYQCNEVVSRTFAKSFILPDKNKVIFFGGTYNGMEISNSFYYYDYVQNEFNIIRLVTIPEERIEPSVLFSERLRKLFIISGGKPVNNAYNNYRNMLILDCKIFDDILS